MTCGLSGKGIQLLNPGWKSFFVIPGFMPYGLIASGIFFTGMNGLYWPDLFLILPECLPELKFIRGQE